MLGLMGFSGSLPLYVIHRYYIFVFIDRANKDACLLALTSLPITISQCLYIRPAVCIASVSLCIRPDLV